MGGSKIDKRSLCYNSNSNIDNLDNDTSIAGNDIVDDFEVDSTSKQPSIKSVVTVNVEDNEDIRDDFNVEVDMNEAKKHNS